MMTVKANWILIPIWSQVQNSESKIKRKDNVGKLFFCNFQELEVPSAYGDWLAIVISDSIWK
jgi:hypothetical protein